MWLCFNIVFKSFKCPLELSVVPRSWDVSFPWSVFPHSWDVSFPESYMTSRVSTFLRCILSTILYDLMSFLCILDLYFFVKYIYRGNLPRMLFMKTGFYAHLRVQHVTWDNWTWLGKITTTLFSHMGNSIDTSLMI